MTPSGAVSSVDWWKEFVPALAPAKLPLQASASEREAQLAAPLSRLDGRRHPI